MLDAARGLSVDLADAESGDGLMARGLSEREAEVAQLVAGGKTYKEIGAQLYISPKTVEHHVARARQKLRATSRAEFLAAIAAASED
ncbi:MAG: helix-turn-helix transcriptional regulator [Acidimicrobiales bacterium]